MLTITEIDKLAKDTGCSEHDDCLTCPLPECIYITGKPKASSRRYEDIRHMFLTKSIQDIANELGISVRTVWRALRESSNG